MPIKAVWLLGGFAVSMMSAIRAEPLTSMTAAAGSDAAASASPRMVVLQRWNLGGPGGWDYLTLDAAGKRLFLSRADRVDVVDTATGKLIGTIPDTNGVHGIALAEDAGRGYTSNGKSDSITVFDLQSLKTIKQVPVSGQNPDAILYEPAEKHVFTFNGRSKDVSILDASSLALVKTLTVPDKPEFAVEDGNGEVFVNIESEAGQIAVIDSRQLTIKAVWPLPGCANPSGLAIDKRQRRLFSVCNGGVMAVTNADTGKQVGTVRIGEGPDAAAFDAQRGLIYSSNGGDGTLTVAHAESNDHYEVLQVLKTQRGARTMALDQRSGRVYLVSADFGATLAPTAEQPHPRPTTISGTFTVIVAGMP